MFERIRRGVPSIAGMVGILSLTSAALGQGNTFNPYGNSGYADYREFATPMYSNNPALPGQSVLNAAPSISRPRANSYQQYSQELDSLDAGSPAARRATSSSLPYYQAYQRLNPQYNRVYKPNDTPEDRKFFERQQKRDAAYAKVLEERDPVKRAQLLKQIEQNPIDRPNSVARFGATGGSNASRTASPAPAPGAISRAPAPPRSTPAPADRRTPAPPSGALPTRANRPASSPRSAAAPTSTAGEPAAGRLQPARPATTDAPTVPTPAPR